MVLRGKENKNIFNVDHKLDDFKDFSQFLLGHKLKKLLCFLGLKRKEKKLNLNFSCGFFAVYI
jgi:hypothetical protein